MAVRLVICPHALTQPDPGGFHVRDPFFVSVPTLQVLIALPEHAAVLNLESVTDRPFRFAFTRVSTTASDTMAVVNCNHMVSPQGAVVELIAANPAGDPDLVRLGKDHQLQLPGVLSPFCSPPASSHPHPPDLASSRFSAPLSMDVGTPYFLATAATSISSARSWRMAVSCSSVRRRGWPSSFPFALAASNPTLVRLMHWRS